MNSHEMPACSEIVTECGIYYRKDYNNADIATFLSHCSSEQLGAYTCDTWETKIARFVCDSYLALIPPLSLLPPSPFIWGQP